MKFKSFSKTASLVGLALTATLFAGCSKMPEEGNFLVRKGFFGNKYEPEVNHGRAWYFLDTVQEVYGREILHTLVDQTPKDKNGILMQDLDITIAFKVNNLTSKGENIVKFIATKSDFRLNHDKSTYLLGQKYIEKDAGSVLSKYFATIDSEMILNDKAKFETEFAKILQDELNNLYGEDIFHIEDIKIANFKAGKTTEERIQSINAIRAEETKNKAILEAANSKKEVLLTNAKILKEVSKETGLTIDQLLESELIKAISDGSTNVQPVIEVKSPTSKPKL